MVTSALLLFAFGFSIFYVYSRSDKVTFDVPKTNSGLLNQWGRQFLYGNDIGYEPRPSDEQVKKFTTAGVEEKEDKVILLARADNDTVSSFSSSDFSSSGGEFSQSFGNFESSTDQETQQQSSFSFARSSDLFSNQNDQNDQTQEQQSSTQESTQQEETTTRHEQSETSDKAETTEAPQQSDQRTTTFLSVDNGKTVVVTKTIDNSRTHEPSAASGDKNSNKSSSGLSNTNKIVVGVVVGVGGAVILGIVSVLFLLKRRSNKDQEGGWTFWRKNEKGDDSDLLEGELGVRDRNINQGSNF